MESFELGFLLGAGPGIIYILRNMKHMLRIRDKAKELAREQGEKWLEFSSWSDSFNFIFHPQRYVRGEDSKGMRVAKEMILSERRRYFVRQAIGGAILVVGAVGGAIVGSALQHFGGLST
jgi:hypothetical protein